jgi:hypothetical protein
MGLAAWDGHGHSPLAGMKMNHIFKTALMKWGLLVIIGLIENSRYTNCLFGRRLCQIILIAA